MTDIVQAFASVIQAIGVILSLVYVAVQIRENTRAVRSQTYQSIISSYADIEARISQDSEVAKIYKQGSQSFDKLGDDEKVRFTQLTCSIFNFYENLYYQYKSGWLEPSLWAGWKLDIRSKLNNPGMQQFWNEKSRLYSKDFRNCVRTLNRASE